MSALGQEGAFRPGQPNVRFSPKRTFVPSQSDVRFAPKAVIHA
jgi:hypothetical protein